MYYGEDIIITRKGIKISAKSLHPIGIEDGSVCWGLVMPPNPQNAAEIVPHLIISAFPPRDWLSLFKLTIKLRDDIGSINKLTKFLTEHRFNVLSTQCALSGYSHATLNITGQALEKKTSKIEEELTGIIEKGFVKNESAFGHENKEFRTDLTKSITLDMLKYSRDLQKEIYADGKDDYLHSMLEEFDTLLYKRALAGEEDGLDEYAGILPTSVSCRWLQQLATYRIYSEAQKNGLIKNISQSNPRYRADWENPIRFTYSSREALLKPRSLTDKHKYLEIIRKCALPAEIEEKKDFPIRVIGSFNPAEHYIRINLPSSGKKNNRLSIQIRYKVDIGLARENIWEIENILRAYFAIFSDDLPPFIDSLESLNRKDILETPDISQIMEILAGINKWGTNKDFETAIEKLRPFREQLRNIKESLAEIEEIHQEIPPSEPVEADREIAKIKQLSNAISKLEIDLSQIEDIHRELREREKEEMTPTVVLQNISENLREKGINIDYVSNTILNYSRNLETGKISLIITPEYDSKELREEIIGDLKNIKKDRESLSFESLTIGPLVSKRIFVSTKFIFWESIKPTFREKLERLVNNYGFTFVTGDRQYTQENSDDEDKGQGTEPHITERIRNCDCFLQIFPRLADKDVEKDKDWLLFELGVARGHAIPYEICIDEKNADEYSDKITAGKTFFKFNSYQDSDEILENIEGAVRKLMERC